MPLKDTYSGQLKPLGYQQVTALTTSTALTVPELAGRAVLQAEAQNVRWRDDGVAPTASVGMIIAAGTDIEYNGDLSLIRFIEVAVSAKLNVVYYP